MISGAIFDCDGTLVDSMQMWYGSVGRLLAAHGEQVTDELQAEVEPMSLPDSCAMLHERLGMGDSPSALLDELHDMVLREYESSIDEIPGVRGFLQSLADAGIPMIVATSTTSAVVRRALAAHDLDHFFVDVVCGAEVREGRDKEFPDVYLEALERLGTSLSEAWVFEDAPFGVRTARRAGFHVCAVHNDHDGRDADFLHAWADVFSEGYAGVSLDALRTFDDARRQPMPEA